MMVQRYSSWRNNCNKMLIRHISIPKNSHLIFLAQPKEKVETEEHHDYHSYFTHTLNPEHPIQDIFSSQAEGLLHHSPKIMKTGCNNAQFSENYLAMEQPQFLEEIEPDFGEALNKQNYQFGQDDGYSQQFAKTRKSNTTRLPTFSPQLSRNAYLPQASYEEPHTMNITNIEQIDQGEDQQETSICNKHFNVVRNKEVYRTIEKFKSKNRSELHQSRLKSHKRYTYDPSKQGQSEYIPSPRKMDAVGKEQERKVVKLEPLVKKKEKPYVSNPSLNEKRRNAMPAQEQQVQTQAIIFQRQKARSSYLRKTSQEQRMPLSKPHSQLHQINKQAKTNKPITKTTKERQQTYLEISYRTPLSRVKQICSVNTTEGQNIIIKVPEKFAYPMFTGGEGQQQLFSKADEVLRHLQIDRKGISLKKYSNCVVIIAGATAIVWHFNGKVYLGGWKHQMLDEGTKHGLGLEWSPQRYVYYGQFAKNRREGAGIMKTNGGELLCGVWRDNQLQRSNALSHASISKENRTQDRED